MRTTNPRINSGVVDSKEFKYDQATKCRKDLIPQKNVMYLNDTKIDDGLGMQDSSKFAKKRL